MKVFKTSRYSDTIYEVETTRTTENSIFTKDRQGRECRSARNSTYTHYYDTFEQAKEYLVARFTSTVEGLKSQLATAEKSLKKVSAQEQSDERPKWDTYV